MKGARAPANEQPGAIRGVMSDLSVDLAARGIEPARIVGHSYGGLLAMRFTLDHPDQASSVLVIDALPFFGTLFDPSATVATMEPLSARLRDRMPAQAESIRAAGAAGTNDGSGAAGMVLSLEHRLEVANSSLKAEPAVVAQAPYEDLQTDLRREIATLTIPLTVLYQAEQNPERAHQRYEADYAALPAARLVPVTGTSHFIMLDRPGLVREAIVRAR